MSADKGMRKTDRFVLFSTATVASTNFASDVLTGLTSNPKTLPPKYFYDKLGSYLFEAICCLPEYHVTRDERELLDKYSNGILDAIELPAQGKVRLIELGSGSAEKTRRVIEALLKRNIELHYVPIDISETSLTRSSGKLLQDYPGISIEAYESDYSTALKALASVPIPDHRIERNIVLFLGSSIGNLDPNESRALLHDIGDVLQPKDILLLGADLKKSTDILLPAYNDALHVTAAFNLNLLVRINRELDGNFDITRFEHRALYNEELGRIEMHLFSRDSQLVTIRAINSEIGFEAGESIHTENSYKFDTEALANLAEDTGFRVQRIWYATNRRFSVSLFVRV